MKIPLTYTHIFELVDDDSKGMAATVINGLDIFTFGFIGLALIFVTRDLVNYMTVVFAIHGAMVVLYFLLAPESPRWLIMTG